MKRQNGSSNNFTEKTEKKHLPKAGATKTEEIQTRGDNNNPETPAEKIKRKGHEILQKMFSNQYDFQEILAEKIRPQKDRLALVAEIEKIIRNPEFYKSVVPRDLIFLWRNLDASNLRWMVLGQKILSQEDAIHTHNKLTSVLVSLEKEKEPIDPESPYSPEFRGRVRDAYAKRVMGVTTEPVNQADEEEENGGQDVDEISAGEPEPGN